jgi:tRNA(Ile)-lysidine synthetase-like protein
MRPKSETEKDTFCVKDFCEKNQIHLEIREAIGKDKPGNKEEIYRKIREDHFLELSTKLSQTFSGVCIATGHHSDDQLETVLMKIFRGSGVKGLSGIARTKNILSNKIRYVRPMLEISKNDIIEICDKNGIQYAIDSTNLDNYNSRNFLRNKIIPEIKIRFPHCAIHSNSVAKSAESANFLVEKETNTLLEERFTTFSSEENFSVKTKIEALVLSEDVVIHSWLMKIICKSPLNVSRDKVNRKMIEDFISGVKNKKHKTYRFGSNVAVSLSRDYAKVFIQN